MYNKNNPCVACGIPSMAKQKDADIWYCMAHGLEYAMIQENGWDK